MFYSLFSQGITFNLIIIRVQGGRKAQTVTNSISGIRFQSDHSSLPLHSVHTIISRYPDSEPISIPLVLARPLESKPGVVWMGK